MSHIAIFVALSVFSFNVLASYPDEINFPHYEEIFRRENNTLNNIGTKRDQLLNQLQNTDQLIKRLESEISSLTGQINQYQNLIVRLEREIQDLEYTIRKLQSDEQGQENLVSRRERELESLRRELDMERRRLDPILSSISRAERDLVNLQNALNRAESDVRSFENSISRDQISLTRVRNTISRLEGMPNREPSQQAELSRLYSERSSIESRIHSAQSRLSSARSQASTQRSYVMSKQGEIRNLQNQYNREYTRVQQAELNINQKTRELNTALSNLNTTRLSLNRARSSANSKSQEVSSYHQAIYESDRRIAAAERELSSAESSYAREYERYEIVLVEFDKQQKIRNISKDEFDQRQNLYQAYLNDSRNLGLSQVKTAKVKGSQRGFDDASKKGREIGTRIAKILGMDSSNWWASVRAEIEGYKLGYEFGVNSSDEAARTAAKEDARKAAVSYADTVKKPEYFEEFLKEEFRIENLKSLKPKLSFYKKLKTQKMEHELSLLDEEISESNELNTDLDTLILNHKNNYDLSLIKYQEARLANNSFENQTDYDFDSFTCKNVYKSVADYVKACENSFRSGFIADFEIAARNSYVESYSEKFDETFVKEFSQSVSENYEKNYAQSFEVSYANGVKQGKDDLYRNSYAQQYDISYKEFVVEESLRAKNESYSELQDYLKSNPLLTVKELSINESVFAGEVVSVDAFIINIGKKHSGSGTLEVLKNENAEIVVKSADFKEANSNSVTQVAGPEVRVLNNLKRGDEFSVEILATLPGDKYQGARREVVKISRKVSSNPSQTTSLNVDRTPSVRSFLNRFLIHTLSIDLTPRIEATDSVIKVEVSADSGNENIDFKVSEGTSKIMKMGEKSNVKLSYVFKDSAKGVMIPLKVTYSIEGRVFQTEYIRLTPK